MLIKIIVVTIFSFAISYAIVMTATAFYLTIALDNIKNSVNSYKAEDVIMQEIRKEIDKLYKKK